MFHFRGTAIAAATALLGLTAAGCSGPTGSSETAPRDIRLAPDGPTVEAKVPRNATFETLFQRHELPAETAGSLLKAVSEVFNPRHLRANQAYRISRTIDGLLREFRYQIDADRLLRVIARPSTDAAVAFSAEVVTLPKVFELDAVVGQLALSMASIFGGEVDFNSDLQPGDRFELLFERATRDDQFAGYGDIKAAVLVNAGRRLTAVWTRDSDGKPVWYDEEGRSLKRQFRKSPLPFDPRITSRFSTNRFHPVHGRYRAHLGVDYGAPTGTAVLATASGVVDFAGWSGEAGRMVRIRHASGYQTAYLHLSSIPAGIRPGVRVAQDDLIGRVGSTGTATGPHLDYRILKNGRYVDPVAELKRMPKGEALAAGQMQAFFTVRDDAMSQLAAKVLTLSRRP
jgi:murein DD-endopeptidase MepM/ murein hydrolase activator NlpD